MLLAFITAFLCSPLGMLWVLLMPLFYLVNVIALPLFLVAWALMFAAWAVIGKVSKDLKFRKRSLLAFLVYYAVCVLCLFVVKMAFCSVAGGGGAAVSNNAANVLNAANGSNYAVE